MHVFLFLRFNSLGAVLFFEERAQKEDEDLHEWNINNLQSAIHASISSSRARKGQKKRARINYYQTPGAHKV